MDGRELLNWLQENQWAGWLGAALALGVVELFTLDLIFLMLAVGALAGMVTAAVTSSFAAAFLVAVAASGASLMLLRPALTRRLQGGPELQLGHNKLLGRQGVVTERITGMSVGRIKLAGEIWTAAPYDETLVIEPGETVEVLEIRGATAYVHPVPSLER